MNFFGTKINLLFYKLCEIFSTLLLTTLLFSFHSCTKPSQCFHSKGKKTEEIRIFNHYPRTIEINCISNVYWHHDSTCLVKIIAGKNNLKYIQTQIKKDILEIKNLNRCNFLREYERIEIHVYSPSFNLLTIKSSGNYYFIDTLKADSFRIDNWADISKIDAKIHCNVFSYSQNAGTGDTYLSGYAGLCYLWGMGYGYIYAKNLFTYFNYITHKSTGNFIIYANKEVGAKLYSSGNLYIYGNPENISITEYHTGKVYIMP